MNRIVVLIMLISLTFSLVSCSDEESYLDSYAAYTSDDYVEYYDYLNDVDHVVVSISYTELMDKLNNDETFILYLGGSWCPNCQAAIPYINMVAKEQDMVVYNFDTRNGDLEFEDDLRNCLNEETEMLYSDLVESLDYVNPDGTTVMVESAYGDMTDTGIYRIPVPTVFAIKNGISLDFITEEFLYDEENEQLEYQESILTLIDLIK